MYFHISSHRNYALLIFFSFSVILQIKVDKNLHLKNYVRNAQKKTTKKKKQKLVYEKYLSHIAKMIDLKLRDEIQNIYLFIYLFICLFIGTYFQFLSIQSDIKENPSRAAKISLSIPNK